tara:strand:- start:265 stop:453 length:189 start_codon:yes stop_codon:yes gene_type:complete
MEEIAKLVSRWPKDRDVPRLLLDKYVAARGSKKTKIGMYVEALLVACNTEDDVALVEEYWAS